MEAVQASKKLSNQFINEWFDKFISHISVDKMMMETETASAEKEQFYKDAMAEDHNALNNYARLSSTKYFVSQLVQDYFKELQAYKAHPQRLAFDFSDAKILVWAQIDDNDESTEDALILSEAKANAKYSENGFYVSSTIVEESDNLVVPPHYHEVKIHGGLSSSR